MYNNNNIFNYNVFIMLLAIKVLFLLLKMSQILIIYINKVYYVQLMVSAVFILSNILYRFVEQLGQIR